LFFISIIDALVHPHIDDGYNQEAYPRGVLLFLLFPNSGNYDNIIAKTGGKRIWAF